MTDNELVLRLVAWNELRAALLFSCIGRKVDIIDVSFVVGFVGKFIG